MGHFHARDPTFTQETSFKEIFMLKICVLLVILVSGEAQTNGRDHQCEPPFKAYKIKATYDAEVDVCANVFESKWSWDSANAICKVNFSYLTERIHFNSTLYLDLVNKSIDSLWLGIRRQAHFFISNFSTLFEEKENVWGSSWLSGEPRSGDCVALNFSTGSLYTRNCKDELPFICEHSDISDVYNVSLPHHVCPTDWMSFLSLTSSGRKCVSRLNEARSQNEAEEICSANKGRLATIREYDTLYSSKDLPASSKDTAYWVNKYGFESCPFKVIPGFYGSSTTERPRNCSMPLQFLCVKDYEIKNVGVWIGKSGINTNETFPRTSACIKEDILTCNVNVTDENLKQRRFFRWYKDDIPISSCNSYYACRIVFVEAALKWKRYESTSETRQGSYHCEVCFAGLVKTYLSPKVEIFFSDVATYSVGIHGINVNNFTDYSHHNFEKSMQEMNNTIFRLLGRLHFRYPVALWNFQSVSVVSRTATMKLVVYIRRTSIRDFDDDEMYNKIRALFEENASEFRYTGNIYVEVFSTDVCFSKDVKSSSTCSDKFTWPTSKQANNVISPTMCLDEHKKPVYRSCKASSVSKAEWSSFNCSLCKRSYNQFRDSPFKCSDGYTRIKEKNICFKIFREKKNWHDAYKECSNSFSYMLNEPFDGIELAEIWLSYRYSHGKIQGVGMYSVNLTLENATPGSHDLHCVSASLENNKHKLMLTNCSKEMFFVCIRNPYELLSSEKFAHTWTKIHAQNDCYYFDNSSYSWAESAKECKQAFYGADLLHGMDQVQSYSYLKKLIYEQFDEVCCRPLSWWTNFTHNDRLFSDAAYVDWSPYINFDIEKPYRAITLYPDKRIHWTLHKADSNLKLACEIQGCEDKRPTRAYIEDRTKLEDSPSLTKYYSYLKSFKLKCVLSGWFIANSMHWYKDGVLLDVFSPELYFNVSSRISLKKALEYQGYYSCSVDQFSPSLQRVYSSDHLLRIPDIHTFALSMVSKNKMYLSDCPKYMLNKNLDDVPLKICFDNHLRELNSGFLMKNLTCNRTHVSITVHVHNTLFEVKEEDILKVIQQHNFSRFGEVCDIDPNVSVLSTVACYRETKKLKNFNVTWPTTPIGRIAYPEQLCLTNDGIFLERKCSGDFNSGAFWSDISVDECSNMTSDITKQLYHLKNEIVDSYESLNHLPNITATPGELKPADVQLLVQIFENLADHQSLTSKELNAVVKTMSNLIDAKPEVFNVVENSSNKIIENFEHIAATVDVENDVNVNAENIIVDIYPFTSDSGIPNCIILSNGSRRSLFNASAKDLQDENNNVDAGIVLPNSLITKNSNKSDRLVYTVYKKSFIHVKNMIVLSFLIHASLPNRPVYDLGQDKVMLFFKLNEKIDKFANLTPKCVFWDHSLNSWSYKGCFPREITEDSVLCVCDHLTSFSVIMEIDSTPIPSHHTAALHVITYIGCSLSCIGYCLIIITFICFQEWRKSVKNKALFNYSLSQSVFLIIFMAGIDQTSSKVFCKAAAILLHYFLLSSFAWMIVLAFTVYLSLVKVLNTYIPCLIQKCMAFAWGVPAVIFIITLSWNHEYYCRKDYCWLSKDVIVYAIIIPLALMLIINFIIFATIFHVNMCRKSYLRINRDKRKLVIARARALFCISILLGLSWIFGFLAVGEAKLTFEYLFSITTPLQGFLLSIFFVVRPKSTRELWKNLFCPFVSSKASTSNTFNSIVIQQRINNRRSQCENMLNSVVYRPHSPFTPYT